MSFCLGLKIQIISLLFKRVSFALSALISLSFLSLGKSLYFKPCILIGFNYYKANIH